MISITPDIAIKESEIHFEFIRSSGPGGQNVNKVATAVQLRFNVANSPSLTEDVKKRLHHLAGKRITEKGVLIINARSYRTQERNRNDAIERLVQLIQAASQKPKPRKETKPSLASKSRRLDAKRQRGLLKEARQAVPANED